MPGTSIALLLQLIDQGFNRQSWHGPNLRGSIRTVTPAVAAWRPDASRHSIAEQVVYAAYWKYVIRRCAARREARLVSAARVQLVRAARHAVRDRMARRHRALGRHASLAAHRHRRPRSRRSRAHSRRPQIQQPTPYHGDRGDTMCIMPAKSSCSSDWRAPQGTLDCGAARGSAGLRKPRSSSSLIPSEAFPRAVRTGRCRPPPGSARSRRAA